MNSLTPSLLDCVDNGDLAFNPAVEISYLDPADQEIVFETIDCYRVSPSVAQAQKLRKEAKEGSLTEEKIVEIMTEDKPMYSTITFRLSTVAKYFPEGTSGKVIEQTIIRLLEEYRQKRENKKTYQEER